MSLDVHLFSKTPLGLAMERRLKLRRSPSRDKDEPKVQAAPNYHGYPCRSQRQVNYN